MRKLGPYPLLDVTLDDDHVATVELRNGDHNHFNMDMLTGLADAFEALDEEPECRSIVLAAAGRSFCAGADFQGGRQGAQPAGLRSSRGDGVDGHLYAQAVRLFGNRKPIVGAIHGAAVGGGLGLALVPDFRVGCPESRFSANFTLLGIHPGFGLSYTLPRLIGVQAACDMFYTGRRVKGEEALALGLLDRLVSREQVREAARQKALEIAEAAPLAVVSVRQTLRGHLADEVRRATAHELEEQNWLLQTADAREGVRAVAERRTGRFIGQ